jgi:hypothetical protein
LVEQRIENPRVGGSIPPLGTIFAASADHEAGRDPDMQALAERLRL